MLVPLSRWNPFDVLIERDSDCQTRPDLSFLRAPATVPLVGRCVIERQDEYGGRQRHGEVLRAIDELFDRNSVTRIDIDTRFPRERNRDRLRSAGEMVTLFSKLDALVTNRLHGLVYAIASGIPALAVDSVAGGGKLAAQARALDWPACVAAENATPKFLDEALAWCLTKPALEAANISKQKAAELLAGFRNDFLRALLVQPSRVPMPSTSASKGWRQRLEKLFKAMNVL